MIEIDEARRLVAGQAHARPATMVPLEESLNLVLAEDVSSDVDSPPHDKAMVDGYAVVAADVTGGRRELAILEEVVAGDVPSETVERGQATRIMTGAPMPPGADAVVMVEQTQTQRGGGPHGRVEVNSTAVQPGANIMRRGTSIRRGDVVLAAGRIIRPVDVGLLAEVGRARVQVIPRPRVAVLATGNELVSADKTPAAGQIRNSNGPMLAALARRRGASPVELGIGRDDEALLHALIARGLESDVLVLSGGVSAGVLDLVPQVLEALGVRRVFHKVRLKPGKPVWFGVKDAGDGRSTLVFGLPGNPVGSFVCFELFVRVALARLGGQADAELPVVTARLATAMEHRGNRPTYHPAILRTVDGSNQVEPVAWHGSADLRGFAAADSLAIFPAGERSYSPGERVEVLPL